MISVLGAGTYPKLRAGHGGDAPSAALCCPLSTCLMRCPLSTCLTRCPLSMCLTRCPLSTCLTRCPLNMSYALPSLNVSYALPSLNVSCALPSQRVLCAALLPRVAHARLLLARGAPHYNHTGSARCWCCCWCAATIWPWPHSKHGLAPLQPHRERPLLLLLDGHHLAHRCYWAMANSKAGWVEGLGRTAGDGGGAEVQGDSTKNQISLFRRKALWCTPCQSPASLRAAVRPSRLSIV